MKRAAKDPETPRVKTGITPRILHMIGSTLPKATEKPTSTDIAYIHHASITSASPKPNPITNDGAVKVLPPVVPKEI